MRRENASQLPGRGIRVACAHVSRNAEVRRSELLRSGYVRSGYARPGYARSGYARSGYIRGILADRHKKFPIVLKFT